MQRKRSIKETRRHVLFYVALVLVGLLSLSLFVLMVTLGGWGIHVAQQLNSCDRVNNTMECEVEPTLTAANTTSPPLDQEAEDELRWIPWLAASTACAVLFSAVTTLSGYVFTKVIRSLDKRSLKKLEEKRGSSDMELAKLNDGEGEGEGEEGKKGGGAAEDIPRSKGVDQTDSDKDDVKVVKDYIGVYRVEEYKGKATRHLRSGAAIFLFFSLLCYSLAIMCFLWAIALGYYHTNRVDKTVADFVLVEVMAGAILPGLLFAGSALLSVVLEYLTWGKLDSRRDIPRLLTSVEFEKGLDYDYWVIEKQFFFRLKKRDHHADHGICYSCDKTMSTWMLAGIVALSLLLAFTHFVDITVVEEITMSNCPVDIGSFDCFNRTTLDFVDCGDEEQKENVQLLHCFRFLRFAIDVNLVTSLAESFAFLLVTTAFFSRVFSAMRILLHLHRSRWWGLIFVVAGSAVVCLLVVFLSVQDQFLLRVDVLSILQVVMVSVFIILVGLLVLKGDWYEKIFDHKAKPIEELLVHYMTASSAEIQDIEHRHALELKAEDPTSKHMTELPTQHKHGHTHGETRAETET